MRKLIVALLMLSACSDGTCPQGFKDGLPGHCVVPSGQTAGASAPATISGGEPRGVGEPDASGRDSGIISTVTGGHGGNVAGQGGKTAELVDAGMFARDSGTDATAEAVGQGGAGTTGGEGGGGSGQPPLGSHPAGSGGVSAGEGGEGGRMEAGGSPAPRVPACGDGELDLGERCDGDCPTTCDDLDPCTMDAMGGSPETCDATCAHSPITQAAAGDGCCPTGANSGNDSDCPASCGNGIVDPGETCDGNCPSTCPTTDPCSSTTLQGSASMCNAKCVTTPITAAKSGDSCCPPGATAKTDSDCPPACGDGVKNGNELCDGNCPTSCDDGDPCTDDRLTGSANTCNAQCQSAPAADGTPCNTTGQCEAGACRFCGDGVISTGEQCDPKASGWNSTTCSTDCQRAVYRACGNANTSEALAAECSAGQSCWFGVCASTCSIDSDCPRVPGAPAPSCRSQRCVLLCGSVSDCPQDLDVCNANTTLGAGNACTSSRWR